MYRLIAVLSAGLMLAASGCGSAENAVDAATDAAKEAAAAGEGMAESAGSALRDVAAGAGGDAVTRCLGFAAKKQWSEALEPCTEAASKNPDDMRIKHAVQQARAAAEG